MRKREAPRGLESLLEILGLYSRRRHVSKQVRKRHIFASSMSIKSQAGPESAPSIVFLAITIELLPSDAPATTTTHRVMSYIRPFDCAVLNRRRRLLPNRGVAGQVDNIDARGDRKQFAARSLR